MANGYCHTNIDDFKQVEWPTEFVAVPRVGERVQGKCGKTLKVVQVTHLMRRVSGYTSEEPCVSVELHR